MSPRHRLIIYSTVGVALGVTIGVNLADESYGLAILVVLISGWLVVCRASPAPPDAWLLAVVLVGYVVGNRGFAQLQPSPFVPILPAEAVLFVAVPVLIFRLAMKRAAGLRRDALNYSVLAWAAIGTIRLPMDMNRYGVIALRDFAMVYYAAFFFIAQEFGDHPASARVLKKSFTVAFALLLPVVIGILISPDFLVDHLTWRGIPIIYHKGDLIATSLAAGFFWLWTRWDKTHHRAWLFAASASMLLIGAMGSPRAGMFAIAVTTVLWVLNGRWRMAAYQVGVVAAAAGLSLASLSYTGKDLETSLPYSMYEHAVSIFDPAGTGTYINGDSGELGGNNRFRLIWWRDVVEDTLATNPAFGLGFGSDLSARFIADFDLLGDETFAARSPHNMNVTVFGRLGVAGFAAWMAVTMSMVAIVWRLLKRGEPDGMGLASVVTVVWLSSCFGVVLEGPMGAIVFWTALGLANSQLRKGPTPGPGPVAAESEDAPGEWPVAKTAALDTHLAPR
jgi:hypothetical protein